MLSNEKYTGTIILFKTVMANYPYSVRRSNDGGAYRQQYCMTNGVDAIIDEETFKAVQDEKKRRSSYEEGPDGKRRIKEMKKNQVHRRFSYIIGGDGNQLPCERAAEIATEHFSAEYCEEAEAGVWIVWDRSGRAWIFPEEA